MIINHLKRTKLDPNREIEVAAQTPETRDAFKTFHYLIDSTKSNLDRGLLIDLHGRGKKDSITQIGYNIKKSELITDTFVPTESSIGKLAMEKPDVDLIKGQNSFGDLMDNVGYLAVPSPAIPSPEGNHK